MKTIIGDVCRYYLSGVEQNTIDSDEIDSEAIALHEVKLIKKPSTATGNDSEI